MRTREEYEEKSKYLQQNIENYVDLTFPEQKPYKIDIFFLPSTA